MHDSVIEINNHALKVRARGKFSSDDARDFVPTPESPLLYIDTPNYDGPLDLLLYLIKKHSMDIFDIPIEKITQKYLLELDQLQKLNLDVAGEFLVMAATLAEIKSKLLLPKKEQDSELEDDENLDPRVELVQKLLVYKSFKEAAKELIDRPHIGQDLFFPPEAALDQPDRAKDIIDGEIHLAPIEIFELVESLSRAIKKSENILVHRVMRDRISVSTRLREIWDFCQLHSEFSFVRVLEFFPVFEKIDIIVTFLAVLEMSRLKLIKIEQHDQNSLKINTIKDNIYKNQEDILGDMQEYE